VANAVFKKHSNKQALTKKRMTILLNVSYYSFHALKIELQMISVPKISGFLSPWHGASSGCGWRKASNMEEVGQGVDNSPP
jgi:hypothetical protein